MFNKEGLITNVLLAAVAGFLMNVAIYQLTPEDNAYCALIDEGSNSNPHPPLSTLALKGEEIFQANCASCHAIGEKVVGPALKGAINRWPDRETLVQFIRNAEKVIESGKVPYATALYQEYKAAGYMQNNSYLTDQEMEAILAFLEEINEKTEPSSVVAMQ